MKKIPRLAVRPEHVYRLFYPSVPSILCAKWKAVSAMPVSSAVAVSDSPARIAVAVKKGLGTDLIMRRAPAFSLNWLDSQKRGLVTRLSRGKIRSKDKLGSLKISYMILMKTPVLEDSLAYVILEKEKTLDVGDHHLFIGRVIGAMASLDFDQYWKFREYRPILYLGSGNKKTFATL